MQQAQNETYTQDLFPILRRNGQSSPNPMALSLQVGLMVAAAVTAAVHLHIAEQIGNEPKSLEELASQTRTHAPSLYLLMRALAGIGIFEEIDNQTHIFANTERSLLLMPHAMADLVQLWGADYQWDSWRDLTYTIQTGKPAMVKQHGEESNIWTYLSTHPQESLAFQRGLTVNSGLIIPSLLDTYDFSGIRSLVDVGGGHGVLTISLLQRYPKLTATLLDRASVIEQVRVGPARDFSEDILSRYTLLNGDFFNHIPPDADMCILKNVLMDWSDEEYVRIVQRVRQAMNDHTGRLLVIEPVLSEETPFTKFFSLQMAMMMHAAQHRTLDEHQALFEAAEMTLTNAIPLGLEYMLLEGHLSDRTKETKA